jgi:two-component system sensor histidine kinase/response regulator
MKYKPLVLIIDDSLVNLMLLHNVLEQHNFRVIIAETGEQGLLLAKESMPDLILLDIIMPGWDGYETCQHIKQEAQLSQIPILFLSALGETDNKVQALQVGGVDYVSKPFQKEELLARVKTHVELAHLRKNLEREVVNQTERVQMLYEALQLSYEKAQQASILKSQFLRNISHEFLTPMNIVLGMTEMLMEETELTEEQNYYAQAVMKAGKQLMDILTNMLNFSQQFKGELKEVVTEFKLLDLVEKILKTFSATTKSKDLPIAYEIAPELMVPVRGNREQIYRVLSKLVENAIKFTEQGYVIIRIQALNSPEEQQWIYFEVIDTGIGIAKDKQHQLFEIFTQVDGSSTRAYDGMGMGLAVAKMFTENMGGQIGLKSELGQGSTFWFSVPLEKRADKT